MLLENARESIYANLRQNLIDFTFNWRWQDIRLGRPLTGSNSFLSQCWFNMQRNGAGVAWDTIWLISIWTSIDNEREWLWANQHRIRFISIQVSIESAKTLLGDCLERIILISFQISDFTSKWQDIYLGQPWTEINVFLFEIQRTINRICFSCNLRQNLIHVYPNFDWK